MQIDLTALENTYRNLSDEALSGLRREDLIPEARPIYDKVFESRSAAISRAKELMAKTLIDAVLDSELESRSIAIKRLYERGDLRAFEAFCANNTDPRCERIAKLITESLSVERYSRVEGYDFLTAIVRRRGAAIDELTLQAIVRLQPPKAGWADEGYEKEQEGADRARTEAHRRLLDASDAEVLRRLRSAK